VLFTIVTTLQKLQKKLIYNALQFCDEEKKNSRLIIPLGTATARASKATGICEWIAKNAEKSEVIISKPRTIRCARKHFLWMLLKIFVHRKC
jgi:hypothetical protein